MALFSSSFTVGETTINRSTCRSTCPNQYYMDFSDSNDVKCLECESPCFTCVDKASKCLACDGSNDLDYVWQNECYEVCPNKTAPDLGSRKCIGCSSNCNKCGTLEGPNCYECIFPYLLEDGVCVSECTKDGFHANKAQTRCINETEFPQIGPIFSIFSLIVVIACLIVKKFKKETEIIPTLVALISVIEAFAFLF